MLIKISQDFSMTPGGRFKKDGAYSGEEFRESILRPQFLAAKNKHEEITIDLDGTFGYGTSFLDEAFGGLARELKDKDITLIKFKTEEEPELESQIVDYIKKGLKG